MFFGKGDSSKLTEEQAETLSHLRRMGETGHIVTRSPDQTESDIRALDNLAQWDSAFKVMRTLRNTGLLVTGLLATWWVAQEQIMRIIGNLTNGP